MSLLRIDVVLLHQAELGHPRALIVNVAHPAKPQDPALITSIVSTLNVDGGGEWQLHLLTEASMSRLYLCLCRYWDMTDRYIDCALQHILMYLLSEHRSI